MDVTTSITVFFNAAFSKMLINLVPFRRSIVEFLQDHIGSRGSG